MKFKGKKINTRSNSLAKVEHRLGPASRLWLIWYTVFGVLTALVFYISAGIIPYAGSIYASQATRDAFDFDSFFGDEPLPERVMLLTESQQSFDYRIYLMNNAQRRIDIALFIAHSGRSSDVFFGALIDAADRGVEVNILGCGIFFDFHGRYRDLVTSHPGINYYEFTPPFRHIHRPWYIHHSMHDKIVIIDDEFVISGGRNVGDLYTDFYAGRQWFYDLEVLIYRPEEYRNRAGVIEDTRNYIESMKTSRLSRKAGTNESARHRARRAEFAAKFREYLDYKIEELGFVPYDLYEDTHAANKITLIHNPFEGTKKDPVIAYNLYMMGMNSRDIVIQSPFVNLTRQNRRRLAEVAGNADRFVMLTNSMASTGDPWGYGPHHFGRQRIARTGVSMYEFQNATHGLHAKAYTFDDRLTVIGSFNLTERSIRIITESMFAIDSEGLNRAHRAHVQRYLDRSLRVDPDTGNYIRSRYVSDVREPLSQDFTALPLTDRPSLPDVTYLEEIRAPFGKSFPIWLRGLFFEPLRFLV